VTELFIGLFPVIVLHLDAFLQYLRHGETIFHKFPTLITIFSLLKSKQMLNYIAKEKMDKK